ncbi:MAG TPA: hypothetical protein VMW72_25480, partial [Sedimentisphaerales bacterium]|nr:hypothetical protein [Sedimentisphaerales bacterium]
TLSSSSICKAKLTFRADAAIVVFGPRLGHEGLIRGGRRGSLRGGRRFYSAQRRLLLNTYVESVILS